MPNSTQLRRTRLAALTASQASAGLAAAANDVLTVTALDVFPLREPVSRRAYTVVRVRTRSGVTGFGECGPLEQGEITNGRSSLLGKPATAHDVLSTGMRAASGFDAAVNMALLDIVGKHVKAPVYQVLGGPTRYRARVFTALSGSTDAELITSMKRAQAAGFQAFAVPVPPTVWRNQGQAYALQVKQTMEALRAAGGDSVDFVLSGGEMLTPGDAASLCSALERFHLLWFDEPCSPLNLGALRKLAEENVTPLGFGSQIREAGGFQNLLREDALDVLRPDVAKWGISGIRKVAVLGEVNYVAVAPFHDGGPIGTAAALHAAASVPNFFIQQIPLPAAEEDRRMRADIAGPAAERVEAGFAVLPTEPGLGITVNESALAKYRGGAA